MSDTRVVERLAVTVVDLELAGAEDLERFLERLRAASFAGADSSTITAKLGPPREVYDLPNGGRRLMWPTQPLGETTTAADIDASGKIVSVRQVLDENEFYKAQIGTWTRKDVLINFGRPVETSYFPLMKREVWTYRYMEANVWYMMYSFYFDDQGTLRLTQKTPDPLHDPDQRNFF